MSALKRLLSRSAGARKVDFGTAYGLSQEGRLEEAESACHATSDASRADVDFLLGLIAEKRGDLAHAAIAMTAAVNARDHEPSFHYGLANVLAALGQHISAIEHFERFLAHAVHDDARRISACITAGQSSSSLNDQEGATSWFRRAVSLEPGNRAASVRVADALFNDSRIEEAREVLAAQSGWSDYAVQLRRTMNCGQEPAAEARAALA